jgi:hypothetical protein
MFVSHIGISKYFSRVFINKNNYDSQYVRATILPFQNTVLENLSMGVIIVFTCSIMIEYVKNVWS